MTQIDTSKWGKFRVGDLFETFHGERLKKSDRIEGSTPFVTAGSENQGVADYIVAEKKYSNAITIDMFGNCFYHDGTLFGDDNIYFLISNNISKYSKLFITTIINSTLKEKYSFSHQFRQKDLDTLAINLPSTPDNFPDWQYMEDYMKEITKLAAKRVEKLKGEKPQTKIDTSNWKKFKIGDLFEFERGKEVAPNKNLSGVKIYDNKVYIQYKFTQVGPGDLTVESISLDVDYVNDKESPIPECFWNKSVSTPQIVFHQGTGNNLFNPYYVILNIY